MLTDYQDGQFIYTQDNLAGAVYEIHAAADIAHTRPPRHLLVQIRRFGCAITTGAEGQVDEVTFSPTRTQATYDFLTVSHDGTKGEVTVTLPLGKLHHYRGSSAVWLCADPAELHGGIWLGQPEK